MRNLIFIALVVGLTVTLLTIQPNIKKVPSKINLPTPVKDLTNDKVELEQQLNETEQQLKDTTNEIEKLKETNKQLKKDLQAKRSKQAYYASLPTGCKNVEPIVERYFGSKTPLVMAIMQAESGCNTLAHNGADNHGSCIGSYGLMQIGCFWFSYYGHSIDEAYNPEVNIKIAHNIYKRQGNFNAWSAFTNGAYLRYAN